MAERINKENYLEKISGENLSLIDFYSDSCIPCKQLNPVLGDLEDENPGLVNVYKVNINFDMEVAQNYDVMSTPTLILFKGGKELDRKHGVQSYETILDWVKQF